METLREDLTSAFRQIRRRKAYAAAVVLVIGLGIGANTAIFVTRYLSSVLWGVTPTDPPTFINVALLFTVVAIAAGLIPTFRALRLEPRRVLAET